LTPGYDTSWLPGWLNRRAWPPRSNRPAPSPRARTGVLRAPAGRTAGSGPARYRLRAECARAAVEPARPGPQPEPGHLHRRLLAGPRGGEPGAAGRAGHGTEVVALAGREDRVGEAGHLPYPVHPLHVDADQPAPDHRDDQPAVGVRDGVVQRGTGEPGPAARSAAVPALAQHRHPVRPLAEVLLVLR